MGIILSDKIILFPSKADHFITKTEWILFVKHRVGNNAILSGNVDLVRYSTIRYL